MLRIIGTTDRKNEELGEVRVRHVFARFRVAASASILHLHHAPALSEPGLACVPEPLNLAYL